MSVLRQGHFGRNLWKWKHTLQACGRGRRKKTPQIRTLKPTDDLGNYTEGGRVALVPGTTLAASSFSEGASWGEARWRNRASPARHRARHGPGSAAAAPAPGSTAGRRARQTEAAAAPTPPPAAAFPVPRGRSPAPRFAAASRASPTTPRRHLPRPRPLPAPPPRTTAASPLPAAYPGHGGGRPGNAGLWRGPGLATSPAPPAFRHTPRAAAGGRAARGRHLGCAGRAQPSRGRSARGWVPEGACTSHTQSSCRESTPKCQISERIVKRLPSAYWCGPSQARQQCAEQPKAGHTAKGFSCVLLP